MTHTIIEIPKLRQLAQQHAAAVIAAQAQDGMGEKVNGDLLQYFQQSRQPFLSDKQYTALYRTYVDMVMTVITNHYKPGSKSEALPVQVSSILDGDEIYRPNPVPMNSDGWESYIRELTEMARRFAVEIAELASNGGDAEGRMAEQQLEAAKFSLSHGLNADERAKEVPIYKDALLQELERQTNFRTRKN